MCRKPVGDGAKRVTTELLALKRAFLFFNCAMQRTSAPNIAGALLPQRARGYWTVRFHATRDACIRQICEDGREYRLLAMRSMTRIDRQSLVKACADADIVV